MMNNLRMLVLYSYSRSSHSNVFLESSLVSLPDTLKILYWVGFRQKSLPPKFCPQNLVRLEMPRCHLKQLWEGDQVFHVIYVPLRFRLLKIKIKSTSMFSTLYTYKFSQFLCAFFTLFILILFLLEPHNYTYIIRIIFSMLLNINYKSKSLYMFGAYSPMSHDCITHIINDRYLLILSYMHNIHIVIYY